MKEEKEKKRERDATKRGDIERRQREKIEKGDGDTRLRQEIDRDAQVKQRKKRQRRGIEIVRQVDREKNRD